MDKIHNHADRLPKISEHHKKIYVKIKYIS